MCPYPLYRLKNGKTEYVIGGRPLSAFATSVPGHTPAMAGVFLVEKVYSGLIPLELPMKTMLYFILHEFGRNENEEINNVESKQKV